MHSMTCKKARRAASHRRHVAKRWRQARIRAALTFLEVACHARR